MYVNICTDVLISIRDDHNAVCSKFPLGVHICLHAVTIQMNKYFWGLVVPTKNNPTWDQMQGKWWYLVPLQTDNCAAESFAVCPGERKVLIATAAFQQYVKSFTCTFKLSLSYSSIFRSYLTFFPFGQWEKLQRKLILKKKKKTCGHWTKWIHVPSLWGEMSFDGIRKE